MILKETKNLELKEKYTTSCLKTISSFATYETGEIIFGVNDKGKVIGLDNVEQTKLSIENGIRDNISPLPNYSIEEITLDGITVVKLIVLRGEHYPYFYKHQVYKRFDTSTAIVDNIEVRDLIMQNEGLSFEDLKSTQAQEDFSFTLLEAKLKEKKDKLDKVSNDTLRTLNLMNKDGSYNRACEILSDNPSHNYASLDMVRFGDTISIFLDRVTIEFQSLLKQYHEGLEMFDKWYGNYEEVSGFYRVERIQIPRESFREALANALIHQDLSINASVRIAMYEDRIEITSAGGLPRGITEERYLNGEMSVPRNPIIASVFHQLGIVEKFGTGIHRIKEGYHEFNENPLFEVNDSMIRIVLPKINYTKELKRKFFYNKLRLDAQERNILNIINNDSSTTLRDMEKDLGISRRTIGRKINDLEQKGFIIKEGSPQNRSYSVLIDLDELEE